MRNKNKLLIQQEVKITELEFANTIIFIGVCEMEFYNKELYVISISGLSFGGLFNDYE